MHSISTKIPHSSLLIPNFYYLVVKSLTICLICEGCYPYVVGGVSSWIQQLVTAMPERKFIIYAIGASETIKGKFKYVIPDNVIEIKEIFLEDVLNEDAVNINVNIPQWAKEEIADLLLGKSENWGKLFRFFNDMPHKISDFLMTDDFYDIAEIVYKNGYENSIFVDFLWTLRSMYMTLFYVLKQLPPSADLYHSVSTGYAGVAGAMGKYFFGSPYILTEHGIYTREREEEIIKANWIPGDYKDLWINFFYNMSRCSYAFTDKTVALFEANSEIQAEMGCAKEKQLVIPNGINPQEFENSLAKDENDESINVGAIIRVVSIKDIKTMLYAFDIVKREIPNAKFYIMGPTEEDPEYYEECLDVLDSLGTKDVIFTGRINVKDYINKMDMLVLTSISEGMPLSVMEAMAAGKPNITTNVGSCKELLLGRKDDKMGECGTVVPIMDNEGIAQAIISLCKNEELRLKMGSIGNQRLKKFYTEKQFKDAYKKLYKSYDKRAEYAN